MSVDAHPESDNSAHLGLNGINLYQHIINLYQWLIVYRQIDINYTVPSLSRFSCAPRDNHLEIAKRI